MQNSAVQQDEVHFMMQVKNLHLNNN